MRRAEQSVFAVEAELHLPSLLKAHKARRVFVGPDMWMNVLKRR
jgi:hypothetical protein